MKKLIILILFVSGIALGFLMGGESKGTDSNVEVPEKVSQSEEQESVNEEPTENEERISEPDLPKDVFVVIKEDATISLLDAEKEIEIIQLDQKKWSDIAYSPDGKDISVLEERENGAKELLIYNIAEKKWTTITSFEVLGAGVRSYIWTKDKRILFTQGVEGDVWLQQFTYPSRLEILKIERVNADIIKGSADGRSIVLQSGDGLKVYDTIKKSYWNVSQIESLDNENALDIEDVFFDISNNRVLLKNRINSIVTQTLGGFVNGTQSISLTLANNLVPLCSRERGVIGGYIFDQRLNTFNFVQFTIREDQNSFFEKTFPFSEKIYEESISCFSHDGVLLKTSDSETESEKWYMFNGEGGLEEFALLSKAKEVSINPLHQ